MDDRGMPRWVKAFAIVALVALAVVTVAAALAGGGDHGPARHVGLL